MSTRRTVYRVGEPTSYRLVRRGALVLVGIHVVLALWSGYRAIWQVFRLRVDTGAAALRAGNVVRYDVITSGRVPNPVVVELVQGARAETLSVRIVRQNQLAVYDPRIVRTRDSILLTPAMLARFAAGPAVLRVTARCVEEFLHVPPPVIRDTTVTIAG